MKRTPLPWIACAAFVFVSPGCDEGDGIRTYEAPKDGTDIALPLTQPSAAAAGGAAGGASGVAWQLPEGWVESPEARPMRLATFNAGDPSDPLEVALSAFPQDVGGALANVNRWRGQLGLDPIEADSLPKNMVNLTEGTEDDGYLIELQGRAQHSDLGETDVAMIVAMVPAPGQTWFLKAVGLPEQVASEREAFITFARALPPTPQTTGSAPLDAGTPSGGIGVSPGDPIDHTQSHWTVPAHWEADPNPSTMLKGAYTAQGESGKVRATIMSLPGDGGGALPNVNRWREQVGLPTLQTLDDQKVSRLSVGGRPAVVIDLVGEDPTSKKPIRTVVALIALPTETWFVKMTGDETAVGEQAPHFSALLSSIHFH